MNAADQLRLGIHAVAGLLMWPVSGGLLPLAASMVAVIGGFAREAWDRRRGRRSRLDNAQSTLDAIPHSMDSEEYAIELEQVLHRTERLNWRSMAPLRLAVRVGPSLGLMGTLIPLADALQGLADGNLPALAGNMVTAFAATVIGLPISVVAYLIAAVRESWVRADDEALAFHAERLGRRTAASVGR